MRVIPSGKLFACIVASHEKGLTAMDQMRNVMRQCYEWSVPYSVSVNGAQDFVSGQLVSEEVSMRLETMARDLVVYGRLIKEQFIHDLESSEQYTFAAHYRTTKTSMIYNQTVISLIGYVKSMDTFSAIADPTRRAMLDMLALRERSAGDIVSTFPQISQPAVSKHLRILRNAGLVTVQIHAQQRIYSLQPKALVELDAWIAKYKVYWSENLDALEQHLSKHKGAKRNEH